MTRDFLIRLTIAAGIAIAMAGMIARPAAAASLKADVSVTRAIVTLADLFDDAGDLGSRPVFRAPDPGVVGALPAGAALEAAAAAGLAVSPTELQSVRVVRRSQPVDKASFAAVLGPAIAERLVADPANIDLTFDAEQGVIHADPTNPAPVAIASVSVVPATGRFVARLSIDVGEAQFELDVGGLAVETVAVPVLAAAVARRAVIPADAVVMKRIDRRRISPDAVRDVEDLVGMAARRSLRAGEIVNALDLEQPRIVLRGETITLVFEKPGIVLTARGRALADAALGEGVTVLNEQSRRNIEGVVVGPGRVRVTPASAVAAIRGQTLTVQ